MTITVPTRRLTDREPGNRLAPGFDALLIEACANASRSDVAQLSATLTRTAWACWGPPAVSDRDGWEPLPVAATQGVRYALAMQARRYRAEGLALAWLDCLDLSDWLASGELTIWQAPEVQA